MTDVSRLPAHVAELFSPRPPLKYLPPCDIEPGKRSTRAISGVSQYLELLNSPDTEYTPTESWLQVQKREKKIKAQAHTKALESKIAEWNPSSDPQVRGDPFKTLFISRLSYDVVESDLEKQFARYGPIERIRVVRETETNKSRGYAFIVFERERDLKAAYNSADGLVIKGRKILCDVERGRTVKSWKPMKLGGGLGGRHYTKPKLLRQAASTPSRDFRGGDRGGGSFGRGGGRGGGFSDRSGGFRGGRRGGDDRYGGSGGRRFDNGGDRNDRGTGGDRGDRGDRRSSGAPRNEDYNRRTDYRDRRDYRGGSSSSSRYDDRRDRDRGRRDYRDQSPGRRY